jgi:hypothetical protein
MASEEEINLRQRLNELQQENIRLKRVDVDLSFSLLESLKEVMGIQSRNTEYEKTLLKTNKDINRAIVNRLSGYNTSKSITREIAKNEDLVTKAQLLQKGLAKTIKIENNEKVKNSLAYFNQLQEIDSQLEKQYELLAKGKEIDKATLNDLKEKSALTNDKIDSSFKDLSILEREYILTQLQTKEIKKQNNEYKAGLSNRGSGEQILEVLTAIPGLSYIARNAQTAINDEIAKGNKEINYFSVIAKEAFNPFNLAIATLGIIVKSFLEINKVQTDFRRETGLAVNQFDALNASLITTSDYIRTVSELTKQFGFNAQFAFDQVNIKAAAELVELTGLSAEEAGNLALYSQTTGTSLEDNLDTLISQTGQINIANKSAVTQRQIFRDVGNVSKAIALTFQGNTSELGKAAQQARILGLNLSQVDKIASGLLDIESSIAAEFEAEVISGRELNLERARFYALTNDLDGVTRELANNQEALKGFVNGTRLEQESIAGALQMSRDEMAEMIFQQRAQLGITDEQARKTAGLTQADFERLTVQESITKSLTKLGDIAATFIEPVLAGIANNIGLISVGLAAFGAIKLVGLISSLAKTVSLLGIMAGLTNPAGAILGITAGIAAIGIGMAAVDSFSAKASQNVGDLEFSPGDSRPRISLQEGGLRKTYVGTTNDEVNMAPGAVSGRNTGGVAFTKEDMRNAIREGIAMATLRVSPNELSNKTQVSNVINQRQYSI